MPATRALCQHGGALRWEDAAWSPLLGVDDSALPHAVYDTCGAKLAALGASVDTLQLAFLSDIVVTNQSALPLAA